MTRRMAIAYLTKDQCDLTMQTVEPLLKNLDKFDLFWIDGSKTEAGKALPYNLSLAEKQRKIFVHSNIGGGPDAAVAYALTTMLAGGDYDYIGLLENDVLLPMDWVEATYDLFSRGVADGLNVGAVSIRCYEDRILCQRDGYALMHNLGWGQQIMTWRAASYSLRRMRTSWTLENRKVFAQLAGVDIGPWWAFRTGEHWLGVDWGNDRMLAVNGFASLALTPSPIEMLGQNPPLAEQGLTIARRQVDGLRNDVAFDRFVNKLNDFGEDFIAGSDDTRFHDQTGAEIIFAHFVPGLEDTKYIGDWGLKFFQGFGPFAWCSGSSTGVDAPGNSRIFPSLTVNVLGPVELMLTAERGGQVQVEDLVSGYKTKPVLPPNTGQPIMLLAPAGVSYRPVRLTALSPGVCFHGLRCREQQPMNPNRSFDHKVLPL